MKRNLTSPWACLAPILVIVLLAAAGCSKSKTDITTDTSTDAADEDVAADTAGDTVLDSASDTAGDTADDVTGDPDAEEDVAGDLVDIVDVVEEEWVDPMLTDDDGDGFSEWDGDCDDDDDAIFPGAIDHIEGVDYDCDSRREYLAKMYVAVDDAFDLCINGDDIGTCTGSGDSCFRSSRYYEVIMESGLNSVGVHGWDVSAVTAAFGMWIDVAGKEFVTRGNRASEPDTASWRYFPTTSEEPQATWCEQSFDDSDWGPALFTAEMTDDAWLAQPTEQNRLGVFWIWDGNPPALLDSWFRTEIILPDVEPVWDEGPTPVCTPHTARVVSDEARRLYNGVDVVWNDTGWVVFYDQWMRGWRDGVDDDVSRLLDPDGTPAAAEVNVNDQGSTGTGGAVWWNTWPHAVWTGSSVGLFFEDGRHNRNGDILYGHLTDDTGAPVGTADTRLESTTSSQKYPRGAWTGSRFGVTWQDDRSGGYEIMFRLVNEDMTPSGTATRLTEADGMSRVPHVAWSGSEFGVVWEDNRDGGDQEIWFTRVAADGTEVGSDVRLTDMAGQSLDPRIAWTGSRWGVVWQDDGYHNSEIAFMLLDPDAATVPTPIRVTTDSHVSASPDMVWTGSRFAIVWRDNRSGHANIWMALLDDTGAKLVGDEQVSDTAAWSIHPAVEWSGSALGVIWMEEQDPAGDPWSMDAWFTTVTCP